MYFVTSMASFVPSRALHARPLPASFAPFLPARAACRDAFSGGHFSGCPGMPAWRLLPVF